VVVIDRSKEPEAVTDDEEMILASLQGKAITAEEIIEQTKLPARRVMSALTMLQLRGLLSEESGKRFHTTVIIKGREN